MAARIETITLTVKRVATNMDFRLVLRYLETYSRTLRPGEGVLLLNKRLTRWRVIGPKLDDSGYIEFRGYAPKGEVYDLDRILSMVEEGLHITMAVPEKDRERIAKLSEKKAA